MKLKPAYLNHMLGLAVLLLLVPAGVFAQEGYYGATQPIARGAEPPFAVLAARTETYSGGGEGYFGAQQSSDTCAQSERVTVRRTGGGM